MIIKQCTLKHQNSWMDNSEAIAQFVKDGSVDLYYNNVKKAYTENNGFYVTDTGKEAMSRVLSPSGYAARLDLTSDAGTSNEDNYRIEVGTDQLLKIQGNKINMIYCIYIDDRG